MTGKTGLIDAMDAAAMELLKLGNGHTIGDPTSGEEPQPFDLKGRVAAFEAVTAYLAVRNKIEPPGAKSNGIDRYRNAINGSTPGRRARRAGTSVEGDTAESDT